MIKHLYPPLTPGNGVPIYATEVDHVIATLPANLTSKAIIHYELGNGSVDLFWQAYRHKLQPNERLVVTLHDPPVVVGKPFEPWFGGSLPAKLLRKSLDLSVGRIAIRRLLRRADAIIVLNPNAVPVVASQFGINPKKLFVAPLTPQVIPTQTTNTKSTGTQILFFGNLAEQKGIDVLLQAFAFCNFDDSVTLKIVGGWGDNRQYQHRVEQLAKTTSAEFQGRVSDQQLAELLAAADIVVLPYHASDIIHASGPLVSALAAGKAVLASDIAVFNADLHNDTTGLLFRDGDITDLTRRLQLLVSDPKLRAKLGAAAQADMQATHSAAAIKAALTQVYSGL